MQHARRFGMRAEDAHRPPGLHQQRLIVVERFERPHDGVERRPIARGASRAAVDDQLVGLLGDLGVEVVMEHAQGGFLMPSLTGDGAAPGGANRGGEGHGRAPRK